VKVRNTLFLLFISISTNAFAEGSSFTISDSFPENKLMQENHVYKNSAVFENLGVYEGNITAIAIYKDAENDSYHCDAGYYLPKDATECALCKPDSYCEGGDYDYNETENQGIEDCPDNMVALAGNADVGGCVKIMRFGEDTMYLTQTKQTSPAFAITIGDKVFYGRMTPVAEGVKSITAGTTRSLHVLYNDVEYTIHDASAEDIVKEE